MTFTVESVREVLDEAIGDDDRPVHLRVHTAEGEICVPVTSATVSDSCVELVGYHERWQPDPELLARIDAFLADPSTGLFHERPTHLA